MVQKESISVEPVAAHYCCIGAMLHITKNTTDAVHIGTARNVPVGECDFSLDQGELIPFIYIHSWDGLLRSRLYLYRQVGVIHEEIFFSGRRN